MGKVRTLWREHLILATDDELRLVLERLRVVEGHRTLDELRSQINLRAQVVGLLAYGDASSDFRYDELARQLKARGLNSLTRETLEQFCRDEGLFATSPARDDRFLSVAVRNVERYSQPKNRSRCRRPYLCGLPEQRPVLFGPTASGHRTMCRVRV